MNKTSFLVAFVLIVFYACSPDKQTQNKQQPNVLFILADDLGYTDLSCMGSTYYETPNIDRIAQNGMRFTNGYAACQVCSPSRASLMSGKLPIRHGITDWIGAKTGEDWRKARRYTKLLPPEYVAHLPHEFKTMPEVFKEHGYNTFFAGKWHLGNEGSYPEDHGFDINQGGYERGGPYSGGFFSPFNNPKMEDREGEQGMSLPMKLARETASFIKTNQDKPFFAYLSFYAVHAPIQTSKEKWEKYRTKAEKQGVDENGFLMERRLPFRKHQDNPVYAGLIEHMDDAVGYVLQTLDELDLANNTIVIFTSDNGGVTSGDNYSTNLAPLRGGKGYQWEGGIRVPFLIQVPWLNNQGQTTEVPAVGTDFFPTLLDLAGIPLQPDLHNDGWSLLPILQGESLPERSLIWHYPHYGNQGGDPSSIIRKGDWKLIHYHETDKVELYDLKEDVGEENDLAGSYSELAEQLKAEMMAQLSALNARHPVIDPDYSQDSFELKQSWFANEMMQRLEKQRKDFLNPDWQPNEDWWGSKVPLD